MREPSGFQVPDYNASVVGSLLSHPSHSCASDFGWVESLVDVGGLELQPHRPERRRPAAMDQTGSVATPTPGNGTQGGLRLPTGRPLLSRWGIRRWNLTSLGSQSRNCLWKPFQQTYLLLQDTRVHIYIYTYIHIYLYTQIHTYTYIYTCTYT